MRPNNITASGKLAWRSPSNIALVKYWGKRPVQIPANPSVSITLRRAYTEMSLEYCPGKGKLEDVQLEFLFEGRKQEQFEQKIARYLKSLFPDYPVLSEYAYRISSTNNFPHSTGIASSASSMSALGLCIAELISQTNESLKSRPEFLRKASGLARHASGSACRSVYGGYVIWGHVPGIAESSDDYAVPLPFQVHPAFLEMKDSILVVSSREKTVSSRAGHELMDAHPYASQRYKLAVENTRELTNALKSGDLECFIRITESEALNLHALMMSSQPSYLLIEPNTLNIVNAIRRFRKETSVPVCFTLDAGPNVHLIYPWENEKAVRKWIGDELLDFCEEGRWIDDEMGNGPERLD